MEPMEQESPTGSPGRGESLRPQAREFVPKVRKDSLRPIRTAKADVFANLDAVPFTPSQGICTPSPTNMAAMWLPHPFHQAAASPFDYRQAWQAMTANYGSPGPSGLGSSTHSDTSGYDASDRTSQPGSPAAPAAAGPPLMFSSVYFPMSFSPTGMPGMTLSPGSTLSDPCTPVRGGGRKPAAELSPAGGAYLAMPPGAYPGSPMMMAVSPGQFMFTQYFAAPAALGSHSPGARREEASTPRAAAAAAPSSEGTLEEDPEDEEGEARWRQQQGQDGGSSSGGGPDSPPESAGGSGELPSGIQVTPAARQIASAMCLAQNLTGEPPQQLIELASLLQAYGLVSALHPPSAPTSPDKDSKAKRAKAQGRLNGDGSVRLNARQRRTLRRAQERAMAALVTMHAANGVGAEQAAASMAAMPMLYGSPSPQPKRAPSPLLPGAMAAAPQAVGLPLPPRHAVPPAFAPPPQPHFSMHMAPAPQPMMMVMPQPHPGYGMGGGEMQMGVPLAYGGMVPMGMPLQPHQPQQQQQHFSGGGRAQDGLAYVGSSDGGYAGGYGAAPKGGGTPLRRQYSPAGAGAMPRGEYRVSRFAPGAGSRSTVPAH